MVISIRNGLIKTPIMLRIAIHIPFDFIESTNPDNPIKAKMTRPIKGLKRFQIPNAAYTDK